jgi:accessory gene regulator protein AgrB
MARRFLLFCGVLASLIYIAMNIFIPPLYEGYNWVTQIVSELSAVDAPTRPLWFPLGIVYTLLVAVFGWGVFKSARQKRSLRTAGILLFLHGIVSLTWSPMHQREVLAAGGGTFTDTWHIVMSVITVSLMFLTIGFGAAAFDKGFRFYSVATILVFIAFGVLTFAEAPNVDKNLPTPFIGLWERINIAAFMVWLFVFSVILLRAEKRPSLIISNKDMINEKRIFSKQDSKIKETV